MNVTVFLIRLLVLAVIFVNGWTDAPNAIATAVGSGAMSFRRAAALAAVCNFVGAALACLLFPAVAATVGSLVSFSDPQAALTALCATLLSIVAWAAAAWRFGLPTSESHALLAGLSGAALALGGGSAALNGAAWLRTLAALALSLPAGALAARICRGWLANRPCNPIAWQRLAAGGTALLHGVQDGQKFLALMLLADDLGGAQPSPLLPLLILTASIMAAGTALGGRPIVEKVGRQLAALTPREGLAADLGAGLVLAGCSALGLPVSTTHAKVAAVCGAGRHPDLRAAGQIAGAWLLTFPGCGLLSFALTRMMLAG
ncbi:MAG TPA: inorganic phosphate transporter [Firmicutes bacterium]|nr:inorganic phosphate transporter [Bacillota bacterium]